MSLRNRRFLLLFGVIAIFALAAAGCGDDDDTGAPDDTSVATTAPDGDEEQPQAGCEATVPGTQVNWGTFAPTNPIDPPNASGSLVGGTELIAFYDVLLRYNIETDQYEPQVAESLTPNDDFTEWTLVLPEGLTYSNGDPFDVDNLLAHLERFKDPTVRNASRTMLAQIESTEKVDDRTVVFHLLKPWSTFPYVFADEPGMVVNTRVIGDDVAAFGQNPPPEAGIGPYTVVRNAPLEEVVFQARDDYWGGPVCIERLRFVYVPGATATYDAFKAGDLQVAFQRDERVYREAVRDGQVLMTDLQDASVLAMFNHRDTSPLSDPVVREAVVLALDENALSQRAYGGELSTYRALIHPDSLYHTDDIIESPYDPDRARQLLEQAKAAGFDGRIRVQAPDSPPGPDFAIAVAGMLEAVGFDVDQRILPLNDGIANVVQGDYDLVSWGFSLGAAEAVTQLLFNLHGESPSNRMGYANPEMDAAVDALLAGATRADRNAALAEINRIFVEDWIGFNAAPLNVGIIVAPNVKGIKQTGTVMHMLDDAYIE